MQYLHRFVLDDPPNYRRCGGIPEDLQNVFHCPSFTMKRRNPNQALGRSVSPENMVAEMHPTK